MASFIVVKKEDLEAENTKEPSQQLRCLTTELACLTRQDGSSSFSQGDTTALAVVYGPAEVRISKELIDRATVEVVYKTKVGSPCPADRKWERIIRNTLEAAIVTTLHPRSLISIIIQEAENLGSYLSCCINAACMALLDAAVSMKFMVAAIAVAIKDSGEIVVDPDKKIEDEARANLTFVFDSVDKNVVTVITVGRFNQQEYKKSLDLARQTSEIVFQFYRDSLTKKLLKSV